MLEKRKKLCNLHHSSHITNKKVYSILDYTHLTNEFLTVSQTPSLLMLLYYRYTSTVTKLITLNIHCTESETMFLCILLNAYTWCGYKITGLMLEYLLLKKVHNRNVITLNVLPSMIPKPLHVNFPLLEAMLQVVF